MLVGCGRQLLVVLEHAQERQHFFAQPLVLVHDPTEILAEMPQLRLGCMYALIARLHDPDHLCEVVLRGRRFLGGGFCS